ncbi:hypothetical protein BLA29_006978, partial [Euroglyphus maynei]
MICRQLIVANKNKNNNNNNSTNSSSTTISASYSSSSVNLTQTLTAKRCRCPIGQHWNKYIRRCEWIHSNSLFQFGLAPPSLPLADHGHNPYEQQSYHGPNGGHYYGQNGNNLINGLSSSSSSSGVNGHPSGSGVGSVHHPIAASNIDLKIFEIVLEIAFLLACLLGYKACSSICCKDQEQQNDGSNGCNTDVCYGSGDERDSFTMDHSSSRNVEGGGGRRDLKSDEESILSSSIMKSSISMTGSNLNKSGTSVPNLMNGLKGASPGNQRSQSFRYSNQNYSSVAGKTNSVKQARRMSRKRRMSRFCARTMARRNSTYTSPFTGGSTSSSAYYPSQNFRRLSSVSASAMSRSSSASTRNLLVKIANP